MVTLPIWIHEELKRLGRWDKWHLMAIAQIWDSMGPEHAFATLNGWKGKEVGRDSAEKADQRD